MRKVLLKTKLDSIFVNRIFHEKISKYYNFIIILFIIKNKRKENFIDRSFFIFHKNSASRLKW